MRAAVAKHSDRWPKGIASQLKATNNDVDAALDVTGEVIKGQIQQSIRDTTTPPLAPATIKRKGFAQPLIETGVLLGSVDYEVSR